MDSITNSRSFALAMAKLILLFATSFLTSCATVKTHPATPTGDVLTTCRMLYEEVDAAIEGAGVRDFGSSPVRDFPYLRTTRLLASFSDELITQQHWSAWTTHMADLDAESRALELRNLPTSMKNHRNGTLNEELNRCRERLLAADLAQPERRAMLREAAHVPDDYVTWWQVLGLYPLTALIVSNRISAWHIETHNTFTTPLAALPVTGELVRWTSPSGVPLTTPQVGEILHRSLDPLGIPMPKVTDLDHLFDTFAPVWEVDVMDNNDHIGMPRLENGPMVDVTRPTHYRKVSHSRFDDQVLLQLNYIVWFPARPGNDIYAGQLDGINWRVTLGPDGEPWLYDVIHNCGCYHEFFTSHHLRLRDDLPTSYFEPPLLPQPAPEQQPLVLRIAPRTHFIQRIYHDESPLELLSAAQSMAWEKYDALRSLPTADGYRSLFGMHGLIVGTERAERFLLWPMGIRSPGAMRQWGRHATAFVGRRHFDDAFLIQSLFTKVP
ncbi:hypothetical protein [Candidatus Nitrotoga sp. M5]|uniref:hypothetical protein n=1 Tax=Candidatus Nitrotoga sp. M5 TaxID=2890409 RepID=UPI001EF1BCB0|nr:hypothetical protein [Candidatus Nitrotoga sp. M5]CAH1385543.1 conserved exported hypothetical protein [Candidatus Nitrotoga sp. M5]